MTNKKQKLELTWIGKGEEPKLEPRILIEDASKSYGDKNTENMLIHGDNLLALKALEQDFTGKIKCIYIDPPYNTGNAFDEYDDGLEHSIWLSLLSSRLYLLQKLLTEEGIIWISLDDSEVHYMKVLCDEVFGRRNFLSCLPTVMNLKGNNDQYGFAGTHEYTLVYAKNKKESKIYEYPLSDIELDEWEEDEIGLYKKGAPLRATGEESKREDRPKMFYPLIFNAPKGELSTIEESDFNQLYDTKTKEFNDDYLLELRMKFEKDGLIFLLPYVNETVYGRWRWGYNSNTKAKLRTDVIVTKNRNGYTLNKKQRPSIGDIPTRKPKTLFYKPEYSSGNGTAQLKRIFGGVVSAFPYPKPEDLISDFLTLSTKPGDWVLDSFLGSGTTVAVAHKMKRKWIGIELGEHANTLCLPRLKKVIDGNDGLPLSEKLEWRGGGGFKFYELAPSLITKDKYGKEIINKEYNPNMLASAMCKHMGFKYLPDETYYWKQGKSTETDYIFTTTQYVTVAMLDTIADDMNPEETLLICTKSYDPICENKYPSINIKKIPQAILGKCEFGQDNYDLNIIQDTTEMIKNNLSPNNNE